MGAVNFHHDYDDNNDGRVGFQFNPSDQQLMDYFLYKKVIAKKALHPSYRGLVHELNHYHLGETQPWLIWDQFQGSNYLDHHNDTGLYFFSKLENISTSKTKSSHIKSKIDHECGGTWSGVSSERVSIGQKSRLRYENHGNEHHTHWLLDEYRLLDDTVEQGRPKTVLRKKTKAVRKEDDEMPKRKKMKWDDHVGGVSIESSRNINCCTDDDDDDECVQQVPNLQGCCSSVQQVHHADPTLWFDDNNMAELLFESYQVPLSIDSELGAVDGGAQQDFNPILFEFNPILFENPKQYLHSEPCDGGAQQASNQIAYENLEQYLLSDPCDEGDQQVLNQIILENPGEYFTLRAL